jgi:hypothetical protein
MGVILGNLGIVRNLGEIVVGLVKLLGKMGKILNLPIYPCNLWQHYILYQLLKNLLQKQMRIINL